ncbi:MAG: hypothetical protein OHK0029_32040 [Armatimonadaceae bacterium]
MLEYLDDPVDGGDNVSLELVETDTEDNAWFFAPANYREISSAEDHMIRMFRRLRQAEENPEMARYLEAWNLLEEEVQALASGKRFLPSDMQHRPSLCLAAWMVHQWMVDYHAFHTPAAPATAPVATPHDTYLNRNEGNWISQEATRRSAPKIAEMYAALSESDRERVWNFLQSLERRDTAMTYSAAPPLRRHG